MTRWSLFVESHDGRYNREKPLSVGEVLFFCESFPHPRVACKAFPHRSAVNLLMSSIVLPDGQSLKAPAS